MRICNLSQLGSLKRIARRDLVEYYCNVANLLPVHERMLFHLYYREGYSTIEIAQLLMVHHVTVARRLSRIAMKLTKLTKGQGESNGHKGTNY